MRKAILMCLILLAVLAGCGMKQHSRWGKEAVFFEELTREEQMLLTKSGFPEEKGGRLTLAQRHLLEGTKDLLEYLNARYGVSFHALYYHTDRQSGKETLYAVPKDTQKGTIAACRRPDEDGTWMYELIR